MRTAETMIADLIRDRVVDYAEELEWRISELSKDCESPIEKLLLAAIVTGAHDGQFAPEFLGGWRHLGTKQARFVGAYRDDARFDGICLLVQAPVLAYRADFLIDCQFGRLVKQFVVECDGHDYHERTKEQAARDRNRDREMTAAGITVIRFTGSEIWKDAASCSYQVFDIIDSTLNQRTARSA